MRLALITFGVALLLFPSLRAQVGERPNFVLVIADDISWNDLGCYGDPVAKTPCLDRLAGEGLVFDAAYLTTSSCSPSRCSIITGRYPHNTGAAELHTPLPADQYMFPRALREAGYYTVLSGKNHMGGEVRAAFEVISPGKGKGKEGDWVALLRERPKDRPFFCWFASTDAHRGWGFSKHAPRYDPEAVRVPPYLHDGPQTRQDLADYFHEVSRLDHFVGALRAELERQEIERATYIIFVSDNGRPFPRCKTRLYDSGIKTPLIVFRPGSIRPGRSASLVSAIDLAPTILDLAGVASDPRIQGVSFRGVLDDPASSVRDFAFAEHNWHVFQAHERMVRSGDLVYIRNAWPERQNLCVESTARFPAGAELWRAEAEGLLEPRQRDVFLAPRLAEELYDLASDPHQLRNLAARAESRRALEEMRGLLDRWTRETADTVPEDPTPDREDPGGQKVAGFRRGTMPGAERSADAVLQPGPVRRGGVHMASGIRIGEVRGASAVVWTRLTRAPAPNAGGRPFERVPAKGEQVPVGARLDEMEGAVPGVAGEVRLAHWVTGAPLDRVTTPWLPVDTDRDFTRQFHLENLVAGSSYRIAVEGRVPGGAALCCRIEGRFRTPSLATSPAVASFCVVTGQDYYRRDDPERGHRIYAHMLALDPDFLVHTGDTVYYDRPRPFARTVDLARFKWNRIYGLPLQRAFHRQVPAYFIRDDHDTLKDDCWPGQRYGELSWERGLELFREQLPVARRPYRRIRWGRDLELWLVEGREYRSPNTLPDGSTKTIWGAEQKRWFHETLAASDATWRVLISATPLVGPDRKSKNDNHANAGFAHEGRELRRFLASHPNTLAICGDRHWQYVSRDPETGLREFSCGPTTDAHAGGFRLRDRSPMHEYLKVCGGFLHVTVEPGPEGARLVLRHRGTDGSVLNEVVLEKSG